MTSETARLELDRVKEFVEDTICQMEVEGGDVRAFAFSLLRAGAELTAALDGSEAMTAAMARLAQRQDIRDGRAGRA